MKKLLLASALAFTFAAPQAFADHHEGGHEGKGKMFEEADTNSDGKLSLSEFKAHHEKKADEWFKKLDTDGDGNVTMDEAKAGREKMHEKMKERHEKKMEDGAEE